MGIDLELADSAAAVYRLRACADAGPACVHDPDCGENVQRIRAAAAADRPDEVYPWEFRYRRFADINVAMRLAGMGYAGESEPGRPGIPARNLESNDRTLVTAREIDEALAAYAVAPVEFRTALEADRKWVAWLAWLAVARKHGGFEAE
ncbi:hypothetical protein [Actinoplanes sp. L3-i22]|uniref:hypothetical protein n=1 Tax=Actinoplanes sp. L3-i22 TaxID=2836373 RepID=UPI001C8520B9|nr:hypothetical protein [Actinoplanes sp. L3-i22]